MTEVRLLQLVNFLVMLFVSQWIRLLTNRLFKVSFSETENKILVLFHPRYKMLHIYLQETPEH